MQTKKPKQRKRAKKPDARVFMEITVEGRSIDWDVSDDLRYFSAMLRELRVDANHGAWRLLQEAHDLYGAGKIKEAATLANEISEFVGSFKMTAPSRNARQEQRRKLEREVMAFYRTKPWQSRRQCAERFREKQKDKDKEKKPTSIVYILTILRAHLGPDTLRPGRPREK